MSNCPVYCGFGAGNPTLKSTCRTVLILFYAQTDAFLDGESGCIISECRLVYCYVCISVFFLCEALLLLFCCSEELH